MTPIATSTTAPDRPHDGYPDFLTALHVGFIDSFDMQDQLFTTDAANLFQVFLDGLPEDARQHYTCNACRHFVERFGGLAHITSAGIVAPAFWVNAVPRFFRDAVTNLWVAVAEAKITGVFITSKKVLGIPVTEQWHHMAVEMPANHIWRSVTKTAEQAAAEKREEFKMLTAGLNEFPLAAVEQAITLLKTDSLYRSEKCLGVAEWLKDLHQRLMTTKNERRRENIIWLAVAAAPAGFCHVRSTMIGTLLDDIVAGLPFDSIASRFAAKMYPLQYQRPQAAPAAGNIAKAEKVIAQLSAAGALERRFARLEEIKTIWKPTPPPAPVAPAGGVFAHITPKPNGKKATHVKAVEIPPVTMTWKKFLETILPNVEKVEYQVPSSNENYCALLTAAHPEAPPILQWDSLEERNPFSWYVYQGGTPPHVWGLTVGWREVTGICYQPSMWPKIPLTHQGESVIFILGGAKDTRYEKCGLGLFPEILKSEFHDIRATIEAFSRQGQLSGFEEASACGLRLQKNDRWSATFRVTDTFGALTYKLDRWD